MNLANPAYGEQTDFQQIQSGAPMGTPAPAAAAPAGMSGGGAPAVVPLDAPSARPDEHVTTGAALGPGVGPESLGLDQRSQTSADLERLRPYLPAFIEAANRPNSTQAFRNYVRQLRDALR